MQLTEELQALLPTDEDVASYRERGWYITPKVLSEDVIDRAAAGAERHWAGERDWPLPISEGFKDWKAEGSRHDPRRRDHRPPEPGDPHAWWSNRSSGPSRRAWQARTRSDSGRAS